MMPSRAQELFQEILHGGTPFIHRMVTDGRPESEILDYKAGAHLQPKDIRPKWATALSAFANTDGGVLIFGVDCRKKEVAGRLLDIPRSTDPYPDPPVLAQKLKDLLRDCTEHPIQGVRIEALSDPSGGGYVICFVPSGNDKPYRSAVDNVYYQRVQDGCIAMSHSLLRSLFFPKTRARLNLTARVISPAAGLLDYHFSLTNEGTATANELMVKPVASMPIGFSELHNDFFESNGQVGEVTQTRFFGRRPLHPGVSVGVFYARWRPMGPDGSLRPTPSLMVDVFLANQEPFRFNVKISLDHLASPTVEIDSAAVPGAGVDSA